MRKIILLAGLVAGGVALSVTASANNWLLYLPAILAGSGGGTVPPPTTESNKWLLFLPAILAGSQGGQPPVVTGSGFNDTGIVLSSTGGVCVENGKEDCNYGRDVTVPDPTPTDGHAGFSFTKLDTGGGELPYDDSTWTCVQDNVTGLVWTDQATWGHPADTYTLSEAQTYANNYSSCGVTADWRIPTPKELLSIVSYNLLTQSVDGNYFRLPSQPVFWTAREDHNDPAKAWYVDFNKGFLDTLPKETSPLFLRLVHGTSLPSQLTDNKDGTVTDSSTELIWKKCLEGYMYSGDSCTLNSSDSQTFTWSAALGRANGEWRLPNIKELQSIVEYQNSSPAINTIFSGVPTDANVWSNSPVADSSENAWYVMFTDGRLGSTDLATTEKYVRLVKDAPK